MEPVEARFELMTWVGLQRFGLHVIVLKTPEELHVALPEPLYPLMQVTNTDSPEMPWMDPDSKKSEFATCVASQGVGEHVRDVKMPDAWHVTTPELP